MIFVDPFFNDDFFNFVARPRRDKLRLDKPSKEKAENKEVTTSETKEPVNNLAKELIEITKKNIKPSVTEDIATWTQDMTWLYNDIIAGCKEAASKGENYYVYEHKVERTTNWLTLYQFDLLRQRLEDVDGLKIRTYEYSNNNIIKNSDSSMNVSFKMRCSW